MSKPINYSDFFNDDGAIDALIKKLKDIEDVYSRLRNDVSDTFKHMGKSAKSFDSTTEDGRKIPHYKVKTETTLTHVDTGAEYNSEEEAQADVDNPGTSTTAEKIRRDIKVFAPSLADMLGVTPE